jgi:hypothetical protein
VGRLDTEQEEKLGKTKNEVEGWSSRKSAWMQQAITYKAEKKQICLLFTVPKCALWN